MPLDQNEYLVAHLKDPIHICLEPEAQGHGMTFKVCNHSTNEPHLCSAYVVSVAFHMHTIIAFNFSRN